LKTKHACKSVRMTENQLFASLKQKDQEAFSFLYDQYAPSIYGIILREVKNSELASEILINTFTNIIGECNTIDCIKQSLFIWLLGITKKTARSDFDININLAALLLSAKEIRHQAEFQDYSSSRVPLSQFASRL
jgi:hypothetical protein